MSKVPGKNLVNRHDPPQYSSVGKVDLNIYNRFAITEYKQKWIVSTNIIYASKKSLVYPCAKIKKGCCLVVFFMFYLLLYMLLSSLIQCFVCFSVIVCFRTRTQLLFSSYVGPPHD